MTLATVVMSATNPLCPCPANGQHLSVTLALVLWPVLNYENSSNNSCQQLLMETASHMWPRKLSTTIQTQFPFSPLPSYHSTNFQQYQHPLEQTFNNPSKGNWNQKEINFNKGWVKKLMRDFSILPALIEKGTPFPLSLKSYLSCRQP